MRNCEHCGVDVGAFAYVVETQIYNQVSWNDESGMLEVDDKGEVESVEVRCGNCGKHLDVTTDWY